MITQGDLMAFIEQHGAATRQHLADLLGNTAYSRTDPYLLTKRLDSSLLNEKGCFGIVGLTFENLSSMKKEFSSLGWQVEIQPIMKCSCATTYRGVISKAGLVLEVLAQEMSEIEIINCTSAEEQAKKVRKASEEAKTLAQAPSVDDLLT